MARSNERIETRTSVIKIAVELFNKSLSQLNRLAHEIVRGNANTLRGRENANVACVVRGSRVSDSSLQTGTFSPRTIATTLYFHNKNYFAAFMYNSSYETVNAFKCLREISFFLARNIDLLTSLITKTTKLFNLELYMCFLLYF